MSFKFIVALLNSSLTNPRVVPSKLPWEIPTWILLGFFKESVGVSGDLRRSQWELPGIYERINPEFLGIV